MKFSVKCTLKAGSLAHLGGTLGPGIYDTESPNFSPEVKEVLIAEMDDPRGLVVCIDPKDHAAPNETVLKDVSTETLDNLSSDEGKAEEDSQNTQPPLGEQGDDENVAASSAPSPTKPKAVSKPRKPIAVKK